MRPGGVAAAPVAAACVSLLLGVATSAAAAPGGEPPRIRPTDTTAGYLARYGIDVQEHFASTDDHYVLRLFRLPRPGAPAVLLQHGILASSWCWLVNTPERSLGIVLWRKGYDVWLSNSRGNTFSRNHTRLSPVLSKKFWDFTFDDMGRFDVVANLKYVVSSTQQAKVTYIGWSQGTTQLFIAATGEQKQFIEQRVNLFVALSPVTYLSHQKSPLLSIISLMRLGSLVDKVWPFAFLDQRELPAIASFFCNVTNGTLCEITVDTVCGTSSLDDVHSIENLVAHFPAGTSVKDLNHYEQLILHERFGRYDYGTWGNLKHYLRPRAPKYSLGQLGVKTALFMGSADDLADPQDTSHLLTDLKDNKNLIFARRYDGYSHLTWLVGGTWSWFDDLEPLLARYNPLPNATLFV